MNLTSESTHNWTFFTNHTHVLLCLLTQPEARLRDIALRVGITERAVQRIVAELEEAEIVVVSKEGRRNRYEFQLDKPLRHPVEQHIRLWELVQLLHPCVVKDDQTGHAQNGKAQKNGISPAGSSPVS